VLDFCKSWRRRRSRRKSRVEVLAVAVVSRSRRSSRVFVVVVVG